MMKPETISAETIKPATPTPSELKTFKLSLLDQLAPPIYVPLILFYSATDLYPSDSTSSVDISNHLKTSLSTTLTQLYPLAGRLRGNISVECNDEGVTYIEAKTNMMLSEILENPKMDVLLNFLPFDSNNVGSNEELAITAVQVNHFKCGGIAIGVCISHKIADGTTLATFVSAWSKESKGIGEIIIPHLAPASIFPPRDFNTSMPSDVTSKEKYVTKRFIFDAQKLALLRSNIAIANPTKVEVVTSLIWKSAMVTSRDNSSSLVKHAVNLRGRMCPRMHDNSLGNLWWLAVTRPMLTKEGERKLTLTGLAGEIRRSIREIDNNYVRTLQGEDGLSKACGSSKETFQWFISEIHDCYLFSSWTRFPLYESDFGWGNPTWACTTAHVKNTIILMGTKSGDGIEAWVTLDEQHMAAFEQDPNIMEFASMG